MIEQGNWKARGVVAVLGKTRGGKPQIAVELELLEGPNTGARPTWYGYFGPSEAAFERTVESLRLLGWLGDNFEQLDGIGSTTVYAVIAHEEHPDTGEVRARVQWINSSEGGPALTARLDAGEVRNFAAEMRGKLAALEQRKRMPQAAPQQQRPTGARGAPPNTGATHVMGEPDTDDIPF